MKTLGKIVEWIVGAVLLLGFSALVIKVAILLIA
jgi:hypothetical protein